MITKDTIVVYKKFDGEIDDWSRMATVKDKRVISGDIWRTIDSLIQDLKLIKKGLASNSFIVSTNKRLGLLVDDDSTIKLLESMV